jgi:hypothetical protein
MRIGASRDEASQRLESRKVEEREKWVQSIVTATPLWEELASWNKDGHVLAETVFQHRESLSSTNLNVYLIAVAPEATISVVILMETRTPVMPVLERHYKRMERGT